jgi:hypothetical protein
MMSSLRRFRRRSNVASTCRGQRPRPSTTCLWRVWGDHQSEEYRDAKVATTLDKPPTPLGPGGEPTDPADGPDGVHHESAHLIQVSNNRYSLRRARLRNPHRLDDGEPGIRRRSPGTAPQRSWPRRTPCAAPMARALRPGRHRPSRSPPAQPSRPAWTVKPCSWIHPSDSASSRVRCACASQRARPATPPLPSQGNPRPRPWATSGEWLKGTLRVRLPSEWCGRPARREVPDRDHDRDGTRTAERPAGHNVREPMDAQHERRPTSAAKSSPAATSSTWNDRWSVIVRASVSPAARPKAAALVA